VVHDSGVQGRYNVLKDAKEALKNLEYRRNKLIAEVDGKGKLNRDPHMINGQKQIEENGFNKYWQGLGAINALMDLCQEYLDSTGRLYHSKMFFSFFVYLYY
jgi:hypothetical protein